MSDSLTLRYEFSPHSNDDFGWLATTAEVDGIRGANGYWVQWQDVVELAAKLSRHPLPSSEPVEVEWGYSEAGTYRRITFISFVPSVRGHVSVSVDIADYDDPSRRCQLAFETTYAKLSDFREALERVMKRTGEIAILLAA